MSIIHILRLLVPHAVTTSGLASLLVPGPDFTYFQPALDLVTPMAAGEKQDSVAPILKIGRAQHAPRCFANTIHFPIITEKIRLCFHAYIVAPQFTQSHQT